jgi:REP element-mobilizing transposase RayT
MIFNRDRHRRGSIRLKGYDYSAPGYYFLTVCTHNKASLFGQIINGQMILNDAGRMIESVWNQIPDYYSNIRIDEMIVMPDHIHGIIRILPIVGVGLRAYPGNGRSGNGKSIENERSGNGKPIENGRSGNGKPIENGHPRGDAPTIQPLSLPDIVHRFKSYTTAKYRHGVHANKWQPFNKRIWQRNYYDEVIKDQWHLIRLRQYIRRNPMTWEHINDSEVS